VVNGLLVESRPVEDGLDGVGNVVDLLVADAPLPDVLAACAGLVPIFLGSTAIVAFVDGGPVIGAAAGSAAQRFAADDRWWRRAAARDEPWTPADLTGVPDDLAEAARAEGFTAAWVLPLADETSAEVMGCIVIWAQVTVEYNIAIDEGLRQARRLASLVIGEERRRHALRRLAATDPLTGLSNRSALRRRLDGAAGPVTLALVDLDDFKPVNDTLGHDAGDLVLQAVAERLTDTVRADDLVVRFGGDEFAVVFADGTSPERAGLLAQRIVDAIGAPIAVDGAPRLTVGASVGLATADAAKVVRRADEALYAAKRAKHGPVASDGPDARRHHPTPRP
jgi:diguanylate cyclase (GGDEF)-like protein